MEATYRRELNETYMILGAEQPCEDFALRILQENQPEGLMRLTVRQVDGAAAYYFEISRGNSLARILEKRQIIFEEMRMLILSLSRTVERMGEYLLDVDHMVLEPAFIYGVPDFTHILFCCHPAYQKDFFEQLRDLIQFLLNKVDHSEEKCVKTAYELFEISRQEYFCFEDLLAVVGREAWNSGEVLPVKSCSLEVPEEKKEENPGNFVSPDIAEDRQKTWTMPGLSRILFVGSVGMFGTGIFSILWQAVLDWRFFAAGVVLLAVGIVSWIGNRGGEEAGEFYEPLMEENRYAESGARRDTGEETELLGYSIRTTEQERMLRSENSLLYESIRIAKIPFVIGKLKNVSDYTLNHPTISRMHARIEQQDGKYFVTDCRSTNGTYINGIRLETNQRYPLKEGDVVEFAELKYIFH